MSRFLVFPTVALFCLATWAIPMAQASERVAELYGDDDATPTEAALTAADDADQNTDEPGHISAEGGSDADEHSADARPQGIDDSADVEVIRERFPNRAVKIEREVIQDADGNYVNHGAWRMWDQKGTLVVEGQFRYGEREGVWNRWYRAGEVELLTKPPYNAFQGPFISQATFVGGKLDGKWTVYDNKQHKISEWEFAAGERHGRSTWWYPTGRKMREIEYNRAAIDGQLLEWSADSKLVTKDTYQLGRKLAPRSDNHGTGGGKKTEGMYLFAKEVVQSPDDWWNAKTAVYVKQGKDEKHGPWVAWYANGQKQAEGEYHNDVQVGKFTWWYANGQKSLEGLYADGEQEGRWIWWHENGQKSIRGEYTKGHPSGRWTWWNEDGKVARSTQMEQGAGEVVNLPPAPKSAARPEAGPAKPNFRVR